MIKNESCIFLDFFIYKNVATKIARFDLWLSDGRMFSHIILVNGVNKDYALTVATILMRTACNTYNFLKAKAIIVTF